MGSNGNGHHGNNGNGHKPSNGQGAMGADRQATKPLRVSAHLRYLRALVERGDATADDVSAAMDFCRKLLEQKGDDLSVRDKNNAAKTIATIAKMTADVSIALDKIERLDAGQDTEQVGVRQITLEFDRSG